MARIGDIMNDIRGSKSYSKLRSKLALEEQDVKSLKILRIVKSHIDYTVYISFIIDDIEYWGNIENINTDNPILKSEVFKDYDLYQPKEWIVKTSGIIIETIKRWLKPESGIYKLLNDNIICYSIESGKQLKMNNGIEIEVVRSHNDKIIIRYKNDDYNLTNDNYIYFNWWFEKIKNL